MTWQTDMMHWNSFPWCCENIQYDKVMTDLASFWGEDEKPGNDIDEVAFFCKAHNYRILTSECPGMDCPHCKIHGHEDFINHLKGIV